MDKLDCPDMWWRVVRRTLSMQGDLRTRPSQGQAGTDSEANRRYAVVVPIRRGQEVRLLGHHAD